MDGGQEAEVVLARGVDGGDADEFLEEAGDCGALAVEAGVEFSSQTGVEFCGHRASHPHRIRYRGSCGRETDEPALSAAVGSLQGVADGRRILDRRSQSHREGLEAEGYGAGKGGGDHRGVVGVRAGGGAVLARRGHRVFGTSRGERADAGGVRMLPLDVRSEESVRAGVEKVLAEAGRIDVLVNNAGYALASLIEEAKTLEVRALFDTNFFGLVRMTKAVLPAMRRQRGGTIINVGSLAGLVGVPGEGFYSATKFAIEGYSESLRYEVAGFGIGVCVVEPSDFKTGFDAAKAVGGDRIEDYNGMRERIQTVFEAGNRHGGDPRVVGELIARIAESGRVRLRYRVGRKRT